jgi:hypothetical protein
VDDIQIYISELVEEALTDVDGPESRRRRATRQGANAKSHFDISTNQMWPHSRIAKCISGRVAREAMKEGWRR